MARQKTSIVIGKQRLIVSNLDKVLWPHDGYTKRDLIVYYRSVARWIVPYLRNRPLSMERYPNGIQAEKFWEKNAPRGAPSWVRTKTVSAASGRRMKNEFIICNDRATLVYVANLAAIALHVWTSRAGSLERPDYLLIDLDPYHCTLATLARVALRFRAAARSIGIEPLVKTTGGKGLHLVIPLVPRYTYDEVRAFAHFFARRVHNELPDLTTLEHTISKRRKGTVFLDWAQVGRGKTVVAPFSVRARPKAPVAWPLRWTQVEAMCRKGSPETTHEMARWNIKNVPRLLAKDGDPWAGQWKRHSITRALRRASPSEPRAGHCS